MKATSPGNPIQRERRFWNEWSAQYQETTHISLRDFHYGPLLPGDVELKLLPPLRSGGRALEIGSGAGQNSIRLSSMGFDCTALDISKRQIEAGRRLAEKATATVRWINLPMESVASLEPETFDLIHSSNALQFSADPAKVIRDAVKRLNPGGCFILSVQHPLFAGDFVETDAAEPLLELRDYFHPPTFHQANAAGRSFSKSFPVSCWFNWILEAGMPVDKLLEPPALPLRRLHKAPYRSPSWEAVHKHLLAFPSTLIVRAFKPLR